MSVPPEQQDPRLALFFLQSRRGWMIGRERRHIDDLPQRFERERQELRRNPFIDVIHCGLCSALRQPLRTSVRVARRQWRLVQNALNFVDYQQQRFRILLYYLLNGFTKLI